MPLYEYRCEECAAAFELLRPRHDADRSQPCPECDADSPRILSRDFAAFTLRGGAPRRLPDDGSHWHLGQKVSKPVDRAVTPNSHPELVRRGPPPSPSIEELERLEHVREETAKRERAGGAIARSTSEQRDNIRIRRTAKGSPGQERAKRTGRKQRAELASERAEAKAKRLPPRRELEKARGRRRKEL
jgi:putative FmdB family regulatory protein